MNRHVLTLAACLTLAPGCGIPAVAGVVVTGPVPAVTPAHDLVSADSYAAPQGGSGWDVSARNTRRLTDRMNEMRAFCAGLRDDLYKIDCLADGLQQWAANAPRSGDYGDARAIVAQAARQLEASAWKYRDTSRLAVSARAAGGGRATRRAIVAVRPDARNRAAAEAAAIIDEARSLLLRSGERSARRRVAFQDISNAVGSTKSLLRSA